MKSIQNANNSTTYTDQVLVCDSCGERYETGFLTEIKDVGKYCHSYLKPTFEEDFRKYPDSNYALIRGVYSLAYRRSAKDE